MRTAIGWCRSPFSALAETERLTRVIVGARESGSKTQGALVKACVQGDWTGVHVLGVEASKSDTKLLFPGSSNWHRHVQGDAESRGLQRRPTGHSSMVHGPVQARLARK